LTINAKISNPNSGQSVDFFNANNGTGNVVLNGQNDFAGPANLQSGVVSVSSLRTDGTGNLGTSSIINIGAAAASNGYLRYTGAGETVGQTINLAGTTAGGAIEQAGTGDLIFSSNLTAGGVGAKTLSLLGSTSASGEIQGGITNSSNGATSINKLGTGIWRLSGFNGYTGATTI